MSTGILNQVNQITTVERFRAYGRLIGETMLAGGFVQDDAPTNWDTVALPAVEVFGATEIWRSDDATVGNGLSNFYIKLEFGRTSAANNPARVQVTLGWNNTFTGNTAVILHGAYGSSASACNHNVSAGNNRLQFAFFQANTTTLFAFSVERTRTFAGVEGDEISYFFNKADNIGHGVIPKVGTLPTGFATASNFISSASGILVLPSTAAGYGVDYGVGMVFPARGRFLLPHRFILLLPNSAFGAGQVQVTSKVNGADRTFILGDTGSINVSLGGTVQQRMALLWE